MMYKKDKFCQGNSARLGPDNESEGPGGSGRIDSTEDYSGPTRKWIEFNSASKSGFAVPIQLIPLTKLSSFERKSLVHRLTQELEQTRHVEKKFELQKTKLINVQQKGLQVFNMKKSSRPGKKERGWNRGITGKFQSSNPSVGLEPNAGLIKQCESLLKKLMSHKYGWVFNTPVDVVELNIPDYFDVIKNPMDLGTIKAKLSSEKYYTPLNFLADIRLTFTNAKTYNSPGNYVHIMADTLSKFFELRWKAIEKKLVVGCSQSLPEKSGIREETEITKPIVHPKKRRLGPSQHGVVKEPIKRKMMYEEKHKLNSELNELADLPHNIIEFLKAQSSTVGNGEEDEIEIDINELTDDTLLTLRKLLDDYLKQKNVTKSEACQIELSNVPGLSDSSLQVDTDNNPVDEDVDIGDEAPVTSCPPIEIDKDVSGSTEECTEAGESEHTERQVSPDKQYRAALLKNRFVDTILKAQEKTLIQNDKGDPEKLRHERKELEMHKKREKARLQAEAKAAEDARKRAEAETAEEAKKRRELERKAAREALLKMEKTVEINENLRFLQDLEMPRAVPPNQQIPITLHETGPDPWQNGFRDFIFVGGSNPLQQLGLYMKEDDDEGEEGEPPSFLKA